jgi:hypothetical protein
MRILAFEAVPSNRGLKPEQLAYVCILDGSDIWQPSHDDGKTHVQWLLLRSVKCHGRAQKYSGAIAVVGDGPDLSTSNCGRAIHKLLLVKWLWLHAEDVGSGRGDVFIGRRIVPDLTLKTVAVVSSLIVVQSLSSQQLGPAA